jgi:hypothetical protein
MVFMLDCGTKDDQKSMSGYPPGLSRRRHFDCWLVGASPDESGRIVGGGSETRKLKADELFPA